MNENLKNIEFIIVQLKKNFKIYIIIFKGTNKA